NLPANAFTRRVPSSVPIANVPPVIAAEPPLIGVWRTLAVQATFPAVPDWPRPMNVPCVDVPPISTPDSIAPVLVAAAADADSTASRQTTRTVRTVVRPMRDPAGSLAAAF